ncbi:hypothetical protein WOLCODRAFT_17370 [Wolfiporia cocos MD-104 SS10]|uniref:Uncharacterized protein n=1 Tax=Wolfiporia cocos (strain MD-104) TaxID=742152 RepID=A0A2H3JYS2_WOLCO|nr:hypothetical protein WOLCODRAFT_17370 [Wolfiporia cocos MD-104 SS10]
MKKKRITGWEGPKKQDEKENIPLALVHAPEVRILACEVTSIKEKDDEVTIVDRDLEGLTCWSMADRTLLFQYVLGPDNDKNYELSKVNPTKLFNKISMELFHGCFSVSAICNQWNRSTKVYTWILQYKEFTGGNGDGDLLVKDWITLAWKTQIDFGTLTPKQLDEWYGNGWKDLWDSHYSDNPKMHWKTPCNSAIPVSSDEALAVLLYSPMPNT